MTTKELSFRILEQIPIAHIESFMEKRTALAPDRNTKAVQKKATDADIRKKFYKTLKTPPNQS